MTPLIIFLLVAGVLSLAFFILAERKGWLQ
jgi:hypothetical protein